MNRVTVLMICLLVPFFLDAQTLSKEMLKVKYDAILTGEGEPSFKKILRYAKSQNSYHFMAIGYFFNANNIMYNSTGDSKYLDYNLKVYNELFGESSKANYSKNRWNIKVPKAHMSSGFNGKESVTYEGYFFRYLAEFYDIIAENDLYGEHQASILQSLEFAYNKWSTPSNKRYGDDSNLFHIRLHIGSHWATVAMYLNKYVDDERYRRLYSDFNGQLKKAMKIKVVNGENCYVWNSTYPEPFIAALKQKKIAGPVLQDVSHGNHVVQFIIDSHREGVGNWSQSDLKYLSNTVRYLMWSEEKLTFSDMVDGSQSKSKVNVGEGWKQSDGWMKLLFYDSTLKPIYSRFFNANEEKIRNRFQSLQTLAVLYSN